MAVFTEPTKWAQTLGKDADVTTIPNTAGDTDPSIDKIFPAVFSIPLAQGGRAVPRSVLNGLFKLLGDWSFYNQNGGIASYSADFDYGLGSVVKYNNQIFLCIKENGISSVVANPSNGVYWISFSGLPSQTSDQIIVLHNNIFRGDDLLTHFSSIDAIQTAVQNGDFSNIYIGDFIPATITYAGTQYTTNYRVAGINTFKNYGNTSVLTQNHLVLMPDDIVSTDVMNDTNTTEGGYVGSKMYTTTLPAVLTALSGTVSTPFYGKIIAYEDRFPIAEMNWAWYTTSLNLPSEVQIYGTVSFSISGYQVGYPSQFPLFKVAPNYIGEVESHNYWLRSLKSTTEFCITHTSGNASFGLASSVRGIRPYFLFG